MGLQSPLAKKRMEDVKAPLKLSYRETDPGGLSNLLQTARLIPPWRDSPALSVAEKEQEDYIGALSLVTSGWISRTLSPLNPTQLLEPGNLARDIDANKIKHLT